MKPMGFTEFSGQLALVWAGVLDEAISSDAKLLHLVLQAQDGHYPTPTPMEDAADEETLARKTGLSARAVRRARAELMEAGLLNFLLPAPA